MALFAALNAKGASVVPSVGSWKHYPAYNDAEKLLTANGEVYVTAAGRLYSFNLTNGEPEYQEYSTINCLSSNLDITDIRLSTATQKIIIAYTDATIDIFSLKNHSTVTISALRNYTTSNLKEVRTIVCHGTKAYLTLPWGVMVIDLQRDEIMDTYRLDDDLATGENLVSSWVEKDSLYVLSSKPLTEFDNVTAIRGALKDNLLDKKKWHAVDEKRHAEVSQKMIDYNIANSLYDNAGKPRTIEDKHNNCYWTAYNDNLVQCTADGTVTMRFNPDTQQEEPKVFKPAGPKKDTFDYITYEHDNLYTSSLRWNWDVSNASEAIVQVLCNNDKWHIYENPTQEQFGTRYTYAGQIAVDPRDTSHVMIASRGGLLEYHKGRFLKSHTFKNSMIKGLEDKDVISNILITSVLYDNKGTLWVCNSWTSNALLSFEQPSAGEEGKWTAHHNEKLDNQKNLFLQNATIDQKGNIWFISTYWNLPYYYQYSTATDTHHRYGPEKNQDGKSMYDTVNGGEINEIKVDNEGNMWIAGGKGIAYLPAEDIGTETNTITQHKVNRDDDTGLADYLLSKVVAKSIVFDSMNRMYVGTKGHGVYVISADRNQELIHYTTDNSNILSDNVRCLAIDKKTGHLYISTDRGLCSVQTDGMQPAEGLSKDNIKVFPNPVAPTYSGPITIEGLPVGCDIKITTHTGVVVHQGQSYLSYYQWDGCDNNGDRCASGVYFILIVNADGSSSCVGKVAIIK